MEPLYRNLFVWLLFLFVIAGCSDSSSDKDKTLSLLLTSGKGGLQVMDYEVLEHRFQKSQQQGLYQAHLIDKEGDILQRISFELMDISASETESSATEFPVALPLKAALNEVKIYKLDISSGHYQLKSDDPLLTWKLPEEARRL